MPSKRGFLNIHLHAHLPFVVNHGTWPHGMEWLHEAAAETYLPLLGVLRRLAADGIRARWSVDVTPVLLEQLAHPVFQRDFPEYLRRKIQFAQEDEAFFAQAGEGHLRWLAQWWQERYNDALASFESLGGDLVAALRSEQQRGSLDLLTCAATHGYMPLLGTDESVRAQWRVATAVHRRHFGAAPCGVWLPECGYRPAGYWQVPLLPDVDPRTYPGFHRIGIEQALSESSLGFFYADGHLVEQSIHTMSPYSAMSGGSAPPPSPQDDSTDPITSRLYRAYTVQGSDGPSRVAVFPRDPRTGYQVWSGEGGYPADGVYLDFHKKRWPGGHRYWRVTGPDVAMNEKHAYHPHEAEAQAREHAQHFVGLVSENIASASREIQHPVIAAPFDAELFGHWWQEGIVFLEQVTRLLAHGEGTPELATPAEYLQNHRTAAPLRLPEGSWGAGGDNRVWLNQDTSWTYSRIYAAEHELRDLCTGGDWRDGGLGERLAKQLCREMLLLESSDWQFLMTTGAARDYAERRFREHDEAFATLLQLWRAWREAGSLDEPALAALHALEVQDSLFAEVNPEFWVRGAHSESVEAMAGE